MIASNIARTLETAAANRPDQVAIYAPPSGRTPLRVENYRTLTFQQLHKLSVELASGLNAIGIRRGTRIALMVPPSPEFFVLTFALFRLGAVPVLIDPGMGLKNLAQCLTEARPEVFIGITKAHIARSLLGWAKGSLRQLITVGRKLWWGGRTYDELRQLGQKSSQAPLVDLPEDETAAILFTSGSTGIPKGAVYTHEIFLCQVELLKEALKISPGEIDLCTFPLFALFAPALNMSAIIPRMDFTRPAKVDPQEIWQPVELFQVTNLFGSPALIRRLAMASQQAGKTFPTLRRVVSAGAPVNPKILELFQPLLAPGTPIYTPYGATESLPVAVVSSQQILGETQQKTAAGAGICVGQVVTGMQARVIRLSDEPIPEWSNDLIRLPGVIGEIAVCGPVVTKSYDARPEQTALAKIIDPHTGELWHRMGDAGYFDEQGHLWFCGRKSQRVELPAKAGVPAQTLYADQCEAVFNGHPAVARTALVGALVDQRIIAVLCVERNPGDRTPFAQLEEELRSLAISSRVTAAIEHFLEHPAFPVDTRHNSKIFREKLAPWAAKQLSKNHRKP